MLSKILNLSKELIAIPSESANKTELTKVLALAEHELASFKPERFESEGIPSLLFSNTPKRPEQFKILLNAHLDVVPGNKEQYSAVERDGKLWGRGADDMKAAAAVLILLFKEIAPKLKYPIGLQLVTDEEVGGFNGARHQLRQGVLADFYLTGETTQLNLKNEAKGVFQANITTHGYAAHAAYPWMGENAIQKLSELIKALEREFPVPKTVAWKTTVNLSFVNTINQSYNKVPDQATLGVDIRYIPQESETIVNKLKSLLPKGVDLEIKFKEPPHFTDPHFPLLQQLKQAIQSKLNREVKTIQGHGASDARHYSEQGIAGVEFGPIGGGLHSDEEWVDVQSLEAYYQILQNYLLSL